MEGGTFLMAPKYENLCKFMSCLRCGSFYLLKVLKVAIYLIFKITEFFVQGQ
jgi:hypothetical protein